MHFPFDTDFELLSLYVLIGISGHCLPCGRCPYAILFTWIFFFFLEKCLNVLDGGQWKDVNVIVG